MPPLPILVLRQLPSPTYSSLYTTISIASSGALGLSVRRLGIRQEGPRGIVHKRGLCSGQYGEGRREGYVQITGGSRLGSGGSTFPLGDGVRTAAEGALGSRSRWPGKRLLLWGARNGFVSLHSRQQAGADTASCPFSTTILPHSRLFATSPTPKPPPPSPPSTSPSSPPPRLPLKKRLLSLPHENIYTLPNILTFSRLLAAPLIGYLVLHDSHAWAIGLFAYAGITDLVDGWIARRWGLQTVVGTVIDPMADKTLMTVVTVCLAVKGAMPGRLEAFCSCKERRRRGGLSAYPTFLPACAAMLGIWLAVIILGRDVLLALSAIYYRYISLPLPKTFARYWDFSLPSAEVHPTGISKVNTALQLGLLGWTVGMPLLGHVEGFGAALVGMQYLVATTTIWSGASYIYTKDAVKILTPKEVKEKSERGGKSERSDGKHAGR
ncbi:hypothetical protein MMC30_009232 [Trapelia coarctata]|nr:hypothetical protein [Trapelia coarctata]